MVPRNLSPSSWEAKAGLSEFEANLVYITSLEPARVMQ